MKKQKVDIKKADYIIMIGCIAISGVGAGIGIGTLL